MSHLTRMFCKVKGKWKQIRGQIKKQWGKLTDNQIDQISGDYERLVGSIQEAYGYTSEKARAEVDGFVHKLKLNKPGE